MYSLWTKYTTETATRPFASGIPRAPILALLVTANNDVLASRKLAYGLCVVYVSRKLQRSLTKCARSVHTLFWTCWEVWLTCNLARCRSYNVSGTLQ